MIHNQKCLKILESLLALIRLHKWFLFLGQSSQMCRDGSKILDKPSKVAIKTHKYSNLSNKARLDPIHYSLSFGNLPSFFFLLKPHTPRMPPKSEKFTL